MNVGDLVKVKEYYRSRYVDWFVNSNLKILSINGHNVKVDSDNQSYNRISGHLGFDITMEKIELIEPNYIEEDE